MLQGAMFAPSIQERNQISAKKSSTMIQIAILNIFLLQHMNLQENFTQDQLNEYFIMIIILPEDNQIASPVKHV